MLRRKFYSATAEVKSKSDCGEHKPILVGGIRKINFGKQFRQGNRVYSADNVAMACLAQPVGNSGGFSYLYLVDDTYKNREPRFYDKYSPLIRAEGQEFNVIESE